MVTSLQTGNMVLLCQQDLEFDQLWAQKLGIELEDIPDFHDFFELVLQNQTFQEE